ncbi:Rap1a/Tai family immunity protein [Acuticoccus sediminis]|uniref:Rap1a/Tai family immunity protein n=1 Tax=Acuticoccus sediminis TaxID=2184697 RepID=UPI001CFE26B2|nr:Rap1a/Tai family immunity protein [Acuticoccus sediminis]
MRTLLVATALVAAAPASAQSPADMSPFRMADRFLENCDARADANGDRPPENYGCLSYMAGLVEGYSVAAFANGNRHPYCLPRPVTLVEMMDMMAVAIERGVPPETPTAVVLHNILTVSFPCDREPGTAEATEPGAPADGADEDTPAGTSGGRLPMAPGAPVVGAPEGEPAADGAPVIPPTPETPGTGLPAAPNAPVVGAPEGTPDGALDKAVPAGTPPPSAPAGTIVPEETQSLPSDRPTVPTTGAPDAAAPPATPETTETPATPDASTKTAD